MLQIVQNGEKCKKPKKWDFQPKITKCAPFWAQKWRFSEKCWKSPETLGNAIIFKNVICCIMSKSMSRPGIKIRKSKMDLNIISLSIGCRNNH